ncbi:class I SAM-dependent methyltransferase [Micromonospora sp. CPCC 206060]|uniref:class I SAM-dependent methyltransferase n=1 Tax=Micromonospora sp. CPCC 206060 TaxID=3122406 RepID=UPI002FEF1A24
MRVTGSTSLLLLLAGTVTGTDLWSAVGGAPSLGLVAAAEIGVSLDRLALVFHPGPDLPAVVSALVGAMSLVAATGLAGVSEATARVWGSANKGSSFASDFRFYDRAAGSRERPSIGDADRVRMLGVSGRALSFGVVAEAYERFRPGYPVALFDMVMTYAGQPVRTALEIGAGTGKATRLFAQRGVTVTATEPDAAMLAELRKHVPASVKTAQAAFEDLRPGESYGLIYAAAALHWTNPEGRWSRMASLLKPGGVFASFGGPVQLADPAVEEAVRAARAPFLESDEVPSPDGTPPGHDMQWPGTELQRSEWFADVQQSVIERRSMVSARDYIGLLSTVSAYLELPNSEQEQVYSRIMQVLPETVEIAADITVHLARRRCGQ